MKEHNAKVSKYFARVDLKIFTLQPICLKVCENSPNWSFLEEKEKIFS